MNKVAIVGLGWVGMPLALSLLGRGYRVVGSKTTPDGVEAARMSGIECYPLVMTPELECEQDDLEQLLDADALVITLPASRRPEEGERYLHAVQLLVDSALAHNVPRIIFLSSTSVYGDAVGTVNERSELQPTTSAGRTLAELETWLHDLPNTSVDILRLAGLVGAGRNPGRFLAGKTGVVGASSGVNLVHQDDVIAAIQMLLKLPQGGHVYNLCAPIHPTKAEFYPPLARSLGLEPPQFAPEEKPSQGKLVDGSLISKELGFEYQYSNPALMPWN